MAATREGRGSHPDEVDVPRQHEPRDPHSDERDHRPVPPGPEDRAHTQAAGLRGQDPQRRDVAAHRDQRHPGLLQDRGGAARHRVHHLQAGPRDAAGGGGDRPEGARQGPGVPDGHPPGNPPGPGGRSPAAGPGPHQPHQQRGQVHRSGRDPGQGGAAGADRREGEAPLLGPGHRHRHDPGAGRQALPAFHPGGHVHHPQARRHRPRPDDLAPARGVDGRADPAGERARRGQHLHLHGLARGGRGVGPAGPGPAHEPPRAGGRRQPRRPRHPGRRARRHGRAGGRGERGRGGGGRGQAARRQLALRRRLHGLEDARHGRAARPRASSRATPGSASSPRW